ncbi:WD40 repeat-like protein [Choiromyces venosus 120613-1]|uniref:WD40 repeat-like protein n=1 Tax=Choiromyces venosus 120613-1 TaxID=1336337 RepID=A0A3N4J7G0_9PEZI|nr:WD40 repeat-like protein [Choiromyces venosus 120613-1]
MRELSIVMSLPTILTSTYSSPKRTKTQKKPPVPLVNSTFSNSAPFEDDERWKLFITTNSMVRVWDRDGCNHVFTSGSEGIVAAKGARDGSVLAIADAQVVILHKIEEGQNKSYRLKGTQRCRLLQYDHESRCLFFTDSIHNSVQTYSLKENKVSDAAKAHPSAVISFAISCDSNLILSCSANPSVIQVHNRLLATTVAVVPRASTASVNICVFHPTRRNIFVLAFNDGVLAAYDYSKISGGASARRDGRIGIGQGGLKEIHAFRHLHDPSIAGSSGITGVQFLPGYRSRAVTVGEDGRAFLVDFDMRDTLGSWHIGAPATSLTVRSAAAKNGDQDDPKAYLIAVGSVHGRCYVYDGHGNKIGEQVVDAEGGKVIGVEWVAGDICIPLGSGTCDPNLYSHKRSRSGSEPPAKVREGLRRTGSRLTTENRNPSRSPEHQSTTVKGKETGDSFPKLGAEGEPEWNDVKETASQGYMRLFSPVKKKRPARASSADEKKSTPAERNLDPQERALKMETQRSSVSAPPLWNESGKKTPQPLAPVVRNDGPAQTPNTVTKTEEKTVHKQGRDWKYTKTTQSSVTVQHVSSGTSKGQPVTDKTRDGKLLSDIRSVRARVMGESGKPVRGNLALFAPYMPGKSKKERPQSPEVVTEKRSSPEKLVTDPRSEASSRARAVGAMDGSGDEGKTTAHVGDETVTTVADDGATDVDEGSFEADIWLAEGKEARRSRKRKQSNADQAAEALLGLDDSNGSRRSLTGSFKSRKTVSWQDETRTIRDVSIAHDTGGLSFLSEPSGSGSPKLKNAGQDVSSPPHRPPATGSFSGSTPFSPIGMRLPGPENAELRSALRNMVMEMQIAFKSEITDMRAEMSERFRQQDILLRSLSHEVQMVRQENQNLRNQLSEAADKI